MGLKRNKVRQKKKFSSNLINFNEEFYSFLFSLRMNNELTTTCKRN